MILTVRVIRSWLGGTLRKSCCIVVNLGPTCSCGPLKLTLQSAPILDFANGKWPEGWDAKAWFGEKFDI